MINSSLEAQEKVDALIIYKFLVLYNDFENCIRNIFSNEWNILYMNMGKMKSGQSGCPLISGWMQQT